MNETSKGGAYKLTHERVEVIRELFKFRDIKDADIANLFGVSREHINSIRHNNRWADDNTVRSNNYREFTKTNDKVIRDNIKKQLINKLLDL